MLIEKVLPDSREKLATIQDDALLIAAAVRLKGSETNLVVVCNAAGTMAGVLTKTDIVDRISECAGAGCITPAATVMTREVISCQPNDLLSDVWQVMKKHGIKHVPIADGKRRPLGVLSARQVMQALMVELQNEEELLRDYVMCVGYR